MIKSPNRLIAVVALFCLTSLSALVYAVEDKILQRETPLYKLDLKYPEGFDDPYIDTHIRTEIEIIKNKFISSLQDEKDLPSSVPGKSSLTIHYQLLYKIDPAISVKLMVTSFNRGSAHPASSIYMLNFIDGKKVQFADLFMPKSTYLTKISNACRKILLENKKFDQKWVMEGTSPALHNYSKWAFSEKGLLIIFDTYQIAPYVDGPQSVNIPLDAFVTWLKPKILKTIWGG